jgi:hypothetical protein
LLLSQPAPSVKKLISGRSTFVSLDRMILEQEMRKGYSRKLMLAVTEYIGNDGSRFGQLMNLFLGNDNRVSQRAAGAISYCVDRYPDLVMPYLEMMLNKLDEKVNDGLRRNTLRVLDTVDIPELLLGKAVDICFRLLASKEEPVAVKVYAMSVLYKVTRKENELKAELRLILEDQLPYSSPAFVSRAGKILKALNS